MEQGQPGLDTLPPDRGAGRLIHLIAGRRPERIEEPVAEPAEHLVVEQDLADRRKGHALRRARRALRLGVERPQRLHHIAEEIEPVRLDRGRRKDIDDPAPDRILALLAHRARADITVEGEIFGEVGCLHRLPLADREGRPAQRRNRRHALHQRARGRHHQQRPLRRLIPCDPREARAAPRGHRRRRADPVIRQHIPARQVRLLQPRRGELRHPPRRLRHPVIARDIHTDPAALHQRLAERDHVRAKRRSGKSGRAAQ